MSVTCIHGYLRRQCEACDLADQLEDMTAERDAAVADNERLRAACRECLLEARDTLTPLSDAEREARRPRPPGLGALHGTIAPRESVNNELTDLKP